MNTGMETASHSLKVSLHTAAIIEIVLTLLVMYSTIFLCCLVIPVNDFEE